MTKSAVPPLSRPLEVREVPPRGFDQTVEASPAECAAVAAVLGLPAIAALTGRVEVTRNGRSGLNVRGTVNATLFQTCVVSLEAFASDVNEPVNLLFAPQAESARARIAIHNKREIRSMAGSPCAQAITGTPDGMTEADWRW